MLSPAHTHAHDSCWHMQGARVFSNSWGAEEQFTYLEPDCTLLDAYMWARPDALLMFAAGAR